MSGWIKVEGPPEGGKEGIPGSFTTRRHLLQSEDTFYNQAMKISSTGAQFRNARLFFNRLGPGLVYFISMGLNFICGLYFIGLGLYFKGLGLCIS